VIFIQDTDSVSRLFVCYVTQDIVLFTTHRTLVFLLLLPLVSFSQKLDNAIEWLTRLQAMEARLNRISAHSPAELSRLAADLRTLRLEMETSGEPSLPEPAKDAEPGSLLAAVRGLRAALEAQQRQKPGSSFHLGRVEVNISAEVPQLSTAETLDESEYRRRNLRTLPEALNLVPGVTI